MNSNLDEVTKVDYSVVIGKRSPVAELDDRCVDDWECTAEFTKYDDGWRVTKLE